MDHFENYFLRINDNQITCKLSGISPYVLLDKTTNKALVVLLAVPVKGSAIFYQTNSDINALVFSHETEFKYVIANFSDKTIVFNFRYKNNVITENILLNSNKIISVTSNPFEKKKFKVGINENPEKATDLIDNKKGKDFTEFVCFNLDNCEWVSITEFKTYINTLKKSSFGDTSSNRLSHLIETDEGIDEIDGDLCSSPFDESLLESNSYISEPSYGSLTGDLFVSETNDISRSTQFSRIQLKSDRENKVIASLQYGSEGTDNFTKAIIPENFDPDLKISLKFAMMPLDTTLKAIDFNETKIKFRRSDNSIVEVEPTKVFVSDECVICLDNNSETKILFYTCFHKIMHKKCYDLMKNYANECPLCKCRIVAITEQ